MKQGEVRGLSRVPPNRPGRAPFHAKGETPLPHPVDAGSPLVVAFRRLRVLARRALDYLKLRRMVLVWILWILGLVCQLVLVGLAGLLVDLCIDLMEVWLQLAEKHLEIVLSEA